jgi:hypothetical protein
MSPQEVAEDIRGGHEITGRVIGCPPHGFRSPHFGLFQTEEQLRLLHGTLRALGYRYSTSTMPDVALRYGPLRDVGGLYEIPVMGAYASPLEVLDSWTHIVSPFDPIVSDAYAGLFMSTVDRLLRWRFPGVLNYYVDPAQVVESEAFFRGLDYCARRGVPMLRYDGLLDLVGRRG